MVFKTGIDIFPLYIPIFNLLFNYSISTILIFNYIIIALLQQYAFICVIH